MKDQQPRPGVSTHYAAGGAGGCGAACAWGRVRQAGAGGRRRAGGPTGSPASCPPFLSTPATRSGEVDWEYWTAKLKEWGPLLAGALFGLGWWCWMDAIVYQKAVVGEGGFRRNARRPAPRSARARCRLSVRPKLSFALHSCSAPPASKASRVRARKAFAAAAAAPPPRRAGFPFKYWLPGLVATLALLLMNLLSRDQLREAAESGEEGADVSTADWSAGRGRACPPWQPLNAHASAACCAGLAGHPPPHAHNPALPPPPARPAAAQFRARLWLFFSLLVAVGAVGGSVAVLISCAQSAELVSVGVASVLQCGFVLAASLLFWGFRSGESDGGFGYIGY